MNGIFYAGQKLQQTQFNLIVVAGSMTGQVGFSVFFKGISLDQSSHS